MKKTMSMVLCSCILLMFFVIAPGAEAYSGEATTLDISQGSVVISASGATGGGLAEAENELNPAGYIITQSGSGTTTNTITVNNGVSAVVTLSGVNINSSAAAFKIADHSLGDVKIIIADDTENYLQSNSGHAGIEKNSGITSGNLIISGGLSGTGILYSHGAPGNISSHVYGGAGIGGARFFSSANIFIEDAVVNATGGHWAAGIGGGLSGSGTNISITGSTVRAIAGTEGAGIGGGSGAGGSNIVIAGSSVYAAAGWAGHNIGGGRYNNAVTPTSDGTTPVHRTDVTLSDVTLSITEVKAVNNITVEGLSGFYTDKTLYTTSSGVLYLWLPTHTSVHSLTSDEDTYTGSVDSATSGVLTISPLRLDLGDGLIRIYPDRFIQNNIEYAFSGKYEITGSYTADTPLRIINDTDTPVIYDITLYDATIIANLWCTAVRIDNIAPGQSGNPENLVVNLTIKGDTFIQGYNHPGLQADSKSIVNLTGADGSSLYITQVYHDNAVSSHITLNLDGICTLVKVNDQPADISAAYVLKPLFVSFHDEHTPGEWTVDAEATCTEVGSRHATCTICGETDLTESIPALGHTPGDEATCTQPQLCTVCGEVLVAALGHTPGDEATCTQPQVCTVCGEVLVAALGHTPGDEATCTQPQLCTVCGEVLVAALGHTPGDEATCTQPQVCTVCGEVLVAALGHTPGDEATCTQPQVCTVCGEVLVAALGHDYDEGICTVCGETDPNYRELPITGEVNRFSFLAFMLWFAAALVYAVRRKVFSAK